MTIRKSRPTTVKPTYRFYASSIRILSIRLLLTSFCFGCGFLPEKGDTEGIQQQAQWLTSARLVVDTDPTLTIVRLKTEPLDSAHGGRHLLIARFDFNPDQTVIGDEYSLHIGFDLGDIRTLERGVTYPLGPPPARVAAYGIVSCLCSPLHPDSVRGSFTLLQRGMAQIVVRVDATLFFTEWNNASRHTTYRLRQRVDGLR